MKVAFGLSKKQKKCLEWWSRRGTYGRGVIQKVSPHVFELPPNTLSLYMLPRLRVCSHTGFVLRKHSRYKVTMLSGYGNGIAGYLPTAQSYKEQYYEALSTPITETAIDKVEEALISWVS